MVGCEAKKGTQICFVTTQLRICTMNSGRLTLWWCFSGMILGFPASCRRSALPYQSRLQNSDIAKLCDFMLRTFPVGVRQRNSETAVKHTSATTFQCTCLSNPIAVYIVVSKVHDHHHHHHHHHGFVIIIMIIMITSVNSSGMGKYHQLIFFVHNGSNIQHPLWQICWML